MDGGHQSVGDAPLVVQHLGDGGQAVGGAGGVRHKIHAGIIGCMVDAHNKHGSIVFGRRGHDNLLGAGIDVGLGLLLCQEHPGGLNHILGPHLTPGDILGIHAGKEFNLLAIDDDGIVGILNGPLELPMHGIVTEHVCHIVRSHKRIVNPHKLDVAAVDPGAEYQAADSAEAVNANFNAHCTFAPSLSI